MRIGMLLLFLVLYAGILWLFILGRKRNQKKVWITSLVLAGIAFIFTIIIILKYW